MGKRKTPASLKSASGGGFSFEDEVVAMLLCEMLISKHSIGSEWGTVHSLERQAADWEPFGDILLAVQTSSGKLIKCGCSVKSNQPVNSKGCTLKLQSSLWQAVSKKNFVRGEDLLGIFCSPLAKVPHVHVNSLCRQARET